MVICHTCKCDVPRNCCDNPPAIFGGYECKWCYAKRGDSAAYTDKTCTKNPYDITRKPKADYETVVDPVETTVIRVKKKTKKKKTKSK